MPKENVKHIIQEATLENIDEAIFNWLKDKNLQVESNQGFKKIPVFWQTADRAFQVKSDDSIRDENGAIIYPIIYCFRVSAKKDANMRTPFYANMFPEKDEKGGKIVYSKRVKQDKTNNFVGNEVHKRGPNFIRKKSNKVVYQIISAPYPISVEVNYKITIKTDKLQHMNTIHQSFMKDGYNNEVFVINANNKNKYEAWLSTYDLKVDEFQKEEERTFETILDIKVLGYIYGAEKNEEKPEVIIRENIVDVKIPRERSMLGEETMNYSSGNRTDIYVPPAIIPSIPEYTTFDEVYAYLVSQGSSYKRSFPLFKKGYAGSDSNIITHFGYNSLGYIVPTTEIDLSMVTDGGFGIVQSVDSPTSVTLVSGHSLPSGTDFSTRVCDVSAGVELYNEVTGRVSGDNLALPSTTGIANGDLIYALGRSEFTIGNSTRNIQLGANGSAYFNGGLVLPTQTSINRYNFIKYWGWFSVYLDTATVIGDSLYDRVTFGHSYYYPTQYHYAGVWRHIASSYLRGIQIRQTSNVGAPVNGPTSFAFPYFVSATRLVNMIAYWSAGGNSQTIGAATVSVNPGTNFESQLVNSSAKILKLSVKEEA